MASIDPRRRSVQKTLEKKRISLKNIQEIRGALRSDIPQIERMVTPRIKHFFGNVNVSEVVCKSYISAVMVDYNKEIIGCLCINNYPNVPSIPPWYWRSWVVNLYKLNYITPRNSLWGHFATFRQEYTLVFLIKMLEYVYEKCYYIKHVLFVIPPGLKSTDWLDPCGIAIHAQVGHANPAKLQKIFLTMRFDFVPTYKIRRAVEQDNDDVVALINKYSTRLKKMYGEFYIAELIMEQQDSERHVIVAEHLGVPVAVMILNNVVNYDMLNHAFKLEVYNGLKKADSRDPTTKVTDHEPHVFTEHETFDSLSLVSVPEYVEHSLMAMETHPDFLSNLSTESVSIDDDYELPTDVAADLEIIMTTEQSKPDVDSGDDSQLFLGTLKEQVGCVILSYTDDEYDKWTMKRNFQGSPSQTQMYHPKIPVYHGEDNAFVIEVIAAHANHDSALRFLVEAAYECFPEKEYCVLSSPSTETAFPLLKLFCRVTPRPSSNFENELYVAHRCAVLTDLNVRVATNYDCAAVLELLDRLKSATLYTQFQESITNLDSKYSSYVFLSYCHIVGFAILSEQSDIEYIISHYQLSTWTDIGKHGLGCHGAINYFVVSPIFEKHSRYFLLELHRLSDFSILYSTISPDDIGESYNRLMPCALGALLPVVPTNLSECEVTSNEYWKLPDVLSRIEQPYSLYISTPLHCGLSRWEVNTKIVVVGASDVALAFLVELLYKNNPNFRVTFNNITLVAPHGVCRQRTNKIREILIPSRSVLHGYYLSQLSLRTYVNIVNGVMSAINRKEKTITVNGTFLPYDFLFLTCGRQYQMPKRSKKLRGKRSEFPHNVFIVNSEVDADIALTKLNRIISESGQIRYTVVVYGHNLETLSCLAALLEFGIPSNNLVFVDPTPKDQGVEEHRTIFDDNDVEDAVMNQIKLLGIDVYPGYHFIDWSFDEEYDSITSVVFESKHRLQEIECLGMFAFSDKMISMRTFLAINRAGLVFDGGLVIGPDCQTNDPNIYAAGSITKYPRRYYADHKRHQFFNQEEIGRKLAEHISAKVLEISDAQVDTMFSRCTNSNKLLVPQYTDPLFVYAILPGKLYYLNVRKPGVPTPQDIAMTADDYGQVLMSGNCKSLDRQGYFRLHLNQGNFIETITCLAKFPIQKVNLTCLWGKHERLLNNLVQRFEMVLIPDLFAFFKEEWTYLLYHDYYKKLSSEMNDILMSLTEEEGNSLIEDIYQTFENNGWKALKPNQNKELKDNFLASEYKEALMEKLLSYFGDHMLYLPMYAHPLLISIILGGYEESPFFKEM